MKNLRSMITTFFAEKMTRRKWIMLSCVFLVTLTGIILFSRGTAAVQQGDEAQLAQAEVVVDEKEDQEQEEAEPEIEEESEGEEEAADIETVEESEVPEDIIENPEAPEVAQDNTENEETGSVQVMTETETSSNQENRASEARESNQVQESSTSTTTTTTTNESSSRASAQEAPSSSQSSPNNAQERQETVVISIRGTLESSQSFTLNRTTVSITEGDTVFDVLVRVTRENGIQLDSTNSGPMGAYVRGINNLYEFDRGSGSGWMYRVNGVFPDFSSSKFVLSDGDVIEWLYTENLGQDIGAPQR